MIPRTAVLLPCFGLIAMSVLASEPELERQQVNDALRKAVSFFRGEVSIEGGYLWQYSADLKLREGEGTALASQAWVQPPGTPTVGAAYLKAYQYTGEPYLLEAARETAMALVKGQLVSGGWYYRIEYDPDRRHRYQYRIDSPTGDGSNTSTLDDDTTQAALHFLMQIDKELELQDSAIHDAVRYGLDKLVATQYPNGAWPQRFVEPPDPKEFPVRSARYPDSWSRTFPKVSYSNFYTFNDNAISDTIELMLDAARIYQNDRYRQAAEKAGDFILLAQMPSPQPAWAQQYDGEMCPAWARKFEPPAVTGGESQQVMRILMDLYQATGNRKYLEPIPRALAYLEKSTRSDGRLARFYELKTNRPLYFTQEYELTYRDDDVPTHYAFVVSSGLGSIRRAYEKLAAETWSPPVHKQPSGKPRRDARSSAHVRELLGSIDARGAWVEDGKLRYQEGPDDGRIIRCQTFVQNITAISQFIGRDEP